MYISILKIIFCVLILSFSNIASADDGTTGGIRPSHGKLTRYRLIFEKASDTAFRGGWHGSLLLAKSTCSGFKSSFLFRHIISVGGNRVGASTSHDGTLFGISRDKGRRLELTRSYRSGSCNFSTALVYANLNKTQNVANIAYAVSVRCPAKTCNAAYVGNAIRAF